MLYGWPRAVVLSEKPVWFIQLCASAAYILPFREVREKRRGKTRQHFKATVGERGFIAVSLYEFITTSQSGSGL